MGLWGEGGSSMKGFFDKIYSLSRFLNVIAGIVLISLMFFTVADVILRYLKNPILGTYELVSYSGAVVLGFSLPLTTWMRKHIYVDAFILRLSKKVRNIINLATRGMVTFLFFWIAWNVINYGMDLQKSGEVSSTIHLPFYFVVYALGMVCLIECLVLFCEIIRILGGKYE
jgi:TRAP-type C4-dicarboxylate transport system permease small subunit